MGKYQAHVCMILDWLSCKHQVLGYSYRAWYSNNYYYTILVGQGHQQGTGNVPVLKLRTND